jgi:hypothetical protein
MQESPVSSIRLKTSNILLVSKRTLPKQCSYHIRYGYASFISPIPNTFSVNRNFRQPLCYEQPVGLLSDLQRPPAVYAPFFLPTNTVTDYCALLGCYAARRGNFLPSVCGPLKVEPKDCLETSVRNYHYSLCKYPEERSSYLLPGECRKSRN